MAVDFDKIRAKLAKLSGQNNKRDAFWRPEKDVEYTVRIIPWRENEGQPFKERKFYYNIGNNRGLLAPSQFGDPDPFQELINTLRDEGSKESYELMKKLFPKMRAYAPVIVRGEEDKGPRLWSFGKMVYQQLLGLMLDEDYGDITDPIDGRDVKVLVSQAVGAQWAKTTVTPRGKQTILTDDEDQVEKWIDAIPNLDDLYETKSYDELSKIINDWLAGDSDDDSTGTERGGSSSSSSSSNSGDTSDGETSTKVHASLDDAFEDLVKND